MEEYITQKGLQQLKKELDELKNKRRWEIAEWLKEASSQGDLSENADYVAAKEAQTELDNRIQELEEKIRNAKVVKQRRKDVADIGSEVHYATISGKNKYKVHLVGAGEMNVSDGKISTTSPLGKALYGKKAGDHIEVITPKGKKKYKIVKIA